MRQVKGWDRASTIAVGVMAALALSAMPSFAQLWPQRLVRIVVPIVPGSSPDVAARTFAERLKARWGEPVIVENRPGADGLIGTAEFAAAKDDHVLLFSFAAPLTVYPILKEKLSYDAARDVLPISMAAETFGTIAVPASLPVRTLSELVAFARTNPGQLNWTSGGGAFPILFAGFLQSTGLEMAEIPYRDQNLAVQDTVQGRVHVIATTMTAALPLMQAGKLRVLAVTNKRRSPLWPDIPTATESGYPDLAFDGLIGMFGPRDIPEDRRERIAADIRSIAADPAIAERLAALGQIVRGNTPGEFAAAIEEQRAQITSIVRRIGRPKG
jgi:tripartite-type tricarboxylate transporter receptor subunit TctC